MGEETKPTAPMRGAPLGERLARAFPLSDLMSGLSVASKRAMRFKISENIYTKSFKSGVAVPIGEAVKQARNIHSSAIAEEQKAQENPDEILSGVSPGSIQLYLRNARRTWSLMAGVAVVGWLFMGVSLSATFSIVSVNRFICGFFLTMLGTIKAIAAARDAYILETRAAVSLRVFFSEHRSRLCPYAPGELPRRLWIVTGTATGFMFLGWPIIDQVLSAA